MDHVRVLPESHRYAVCAPDEGAIKTYYKGIYEEVFIFFHPFIRPVSIDYEMFNPETYPSKNEIIEKCQPVTWKEFLRISEIESYRQLDLGLRTSILGLKEEFADEHLADIIVNTCQSHKLIMPKEGVFPEILLNKVLDAIKKQGHEWIWNGDEFCTERKLEYMDDIIEGNDILRQRANLFTNNNEILLTTHWDSHFSMICSDKNTVDQIVRLCDLEGFYCDDETQIYWSLRNT